MTDRGGDSTTGFDWADIIAAAGAACLAPAVVGALLLQIVSSPSFRNLDGFFQFFVPAFVVTILHVVLLGVPLAVFLVKRGWMGLRSALACGFGVGALPDGLIFLLLSLEELSLPPTEVDDFYVDGTAVHMDWFVPLGFAAIAGGFGLLGGLAFWLTLRSVQVRGRG